MAITNAQQYQQLVNKPANGKRPGYRGPGGYQGGASSRSGPPGGGATAGGSGRDFSGGNQNTGGGGRDRDFQQRGMSKTDYAKSARVNLGGQKEDKTIKDFINNYVKDRQKLAYNLSSFIPGQKKKSATMQKAYRDYLKSMGVTPPNTLTGEEDDLAEFFVENAFDRTSPSYKDPITDEVKSIQNYGDFIAENFGAPGVMMSGNVGGLEKFVATRNPDGSPATFGYRNVGGGEGSNILLPQGIMAQAPSIMDQEPEEEEGLRLAFRAEGGPIGGGIMDTDIVGGEMDFKTARQKYKLGKLVGKVTKAVKKIVKSPIGKAALLGAGFGLAGMGPFKGLQTTPFGSSISNFFGRGSFNPLKAIAGSIDTASGLDAVRSPFGELISKIPGGAVTAGIVGTSALSGFLTPEQEEEAQQLADDTGFSIEEARNSILARVRDDYKMDFRARGFRAEGGPAEGKEPVAKKTMPLLDMDGQEMDLRAEGGFVPIGRMEKADDVPARLSKNEFVFTADAVRNAGEGDVDKGAEVMYNMMKNLESGGDVSEESQGLDGARKMFQTSQRLEEVL